MIVVVIVIIKFSLYNLFTYDMVKHEFSYIWTSFNESMNEYRSIVHVWCREAAVQQVCLLTHYVKLNLLLRSSYSLC